MFCKDSAAVVKLTRLEHHFVSSSAPMCTDLVNGHFCHAPNYRLRNKQTSNTFLLEYLFSSAVRKTHPSTKGFSMLMPALVGPHSPLLGVTILLNVAAICWFLNRGPINTFLKPGITNMVPGKIEYPALKPSPEMLISSQDISR